MSEPEGDEPQRQRVEKVPGRRRARLTPAPGTDPSPEVAPKAERPPRTTGRGPNDDQLLRDVPPHY
ncbi:hypothetical protein LG322_04325 [Microbacterium aerolatum]|uniref:Uncharacterized protein n=1 Tax=Microbacterium aerolatum TaxID=153731 RepID=A0A511AMF4_9MICO|nr:hypothetical protein [Microbacterium aerolatum]GEK87047.1 hypothetical protein MAE01_22230 [Microbacterium aerolatum]GGB35558.1 hypothetical protein GCM10007198_27620 [Microbacterium aerolatum]